LLITAAIKRLNTQVSGKINRTSSFESTKNIFGFIWRKNTFLVGYTNKEPGIKIDGDGEKLFSPSNVRISNISLTCLVIGNLHNNHNE